MSGWRELFGLTGKVPTATRMAGGTNIGCRRKQNQDAWAFGCAGEKVEVEQREDGRESREMKFPSWVAVADGMGGAKGGEVASRRALEIVGGIIGQASRADEERALDLMESALREAHRKLEQEANENPNLKGMGCTYSTLWWAGDNSSRAVLGQVGDSRIYRWRRGELTQLTRDQTLVQRMLDEGSITPENAVKAKFSSVLEYALGANGGDLEPEVRWVDFEPGDLLLLCSDGLSGVLSDEELARIMPMKPGHDLSPICDRLIEAARAGGAPDNVTVVLVQVV